MGPVWPLGLQFASVRSKWILLNSWPICRRLISKPLKVAARGMWSNEKIPPSPSGQVGHAPTSSSTSLGVSGLPLLPAPWSAEHRQKAVVQHLGGGGVLRPLLLLWFRTRVHLCKKSSLEKSLVKTLFLKH